MMWCEEIEIDIEIDKWQNFLRCVVLLGFSLPTFFCVFVRVPAKFF